MVSDLAIVNIELGKEQLVHGFLETGAATGVEGLGVVQQFQGSREILVANIQFAASISDLALNLLTLNLDSIKLLPNLLLGPAWRANKLKVLILFGIQLLQPSRQTLLEPIQRAKLQQQYIVKRSPQRGTEFFTQPSSGVVVDNRFLKHADWNHALVAGAVLPTHAEIVEVDAAIAFAAHNDQRVSVKQPPGRYLPSETRPRLIAIKLAAASKLIRPVPLVVVVVPIAPRIRVEAVSWWLAWRIV